jgi:hypothetical protein
MKTIVPRKLNLVFMMGLSIILLGCVAHINNMMQSWVGHHQSELIASWGPPDQISTDGKGGSVLIYGSYVNLGQTPGQATINGNQITYTAPQQNGYRRTRMFYVDKDGYIYSWRWQGL